MNLRWIAVTAATGAIGLLSALPASAEARATGTPAGQHAAAAASAQSVRPNLLCSTQFVANGVRIHSQPNLSSTVRGLGYYGQWFDVQFITDPNGTWFAYGTDRSTGVTGYVDDQDGFLNINECP
jgi:hypothetical protein